MKSLVDGLRQRWQYLWKLHYQTVDCLRFRFAFKERILAAQAGGGSGSGLKRAAGSGEISNITPKKPGKPSVDEETGPDYGPRQRYGLFAGPLLFLLLLIMPTPEGMSTDAQRILAGTAWMAVWWISEAIPIPVTSLLPIVLFPLTGAMPVGETTASYANPNVFLFMGGFMIAVCMEKWNLHRRIALLIINFVGTSPNNLILGFMVATGFLSMWISNTATTMMMLPIGLAVIYQVGNLVHEQGIKGIDTSKGKFNFGTCLMLCIGYSASIGGVATLIGTPPNIIFAGAAEEMFGVTIGFAHWMAFGFPISIVFMFLAWYYMTRFAYPTNLKDIPGSRQVIRSELKELGPTTKEEKLIAGVFIFVAVAWISRAFILVNYFPMINDALIAVLGAVVTFLIPVNLKKGQFLNDWETAVKVPWGILLLFGGGLAIAAGFSGSGLAEWIGLQLSILEGSSMLIIMLAVVALVIYLTEITSNTATTSMMMPIMAAMAVAMGVHPYAMMITAAAAASYAFMLPVATPPNAVIFGSGYITIPQMVKAGIWLNMLGVVVITLFAYYWLPVVFAL